MISNPPLTSKERSTSILFLGFFPILYLGFYLGSYSTQIGLPENILHVTLRVLACAFPAGVFSALFPRSYLLPVILYLSAYCIGYCIAVNLFQKTVFPFELLFILLFGFYTAVSASWLRSRCDKAEQGAAANP
jgi:hypothetical protein